MSVTETFEARGLHCSSCSMLITMAVEDLDGVAAVSCNHATGDTTVMYDPSIVTAERVREAIVEAGYSVDAVHKRGRSS